MTASSLLTPSTQKSELERQQPGAEIEISHSGTGEQPNPGRSSARHTMARAKVGDVSSQFCQQPESPWTKTTASGCCSGVRCGLSSLRQ